MLDPNAVNRLVVGNQYVTATQAHRKWLTKFVTLVTQGSYAVGANSSNIIVQDRRTGMLQEEKMQTYVRLGMRLAYRGGISGGMEGARGEYFHNQEIYSQLADQSRRLTGIVRRMLESMTIKQGQKYDSPSSVSEILPFIRFHNLDLNEVLEPLSSFRTFNEFFYRKLKPGARPIPSDRNVLVSPADVSVSQHYYSELETHRRSRVGPHCLL